MELQMLSVSLICVIYWEDREEPQGNSSDSEKVEQRSLLFQKFCSILMRLKGGCLP